MLFFPEKTATFSVAITSSVSSVSHDPSEIIYLFIYLFQTVLVEYTTGNLVFVSETDYVSWQMMFKTSFEGFEMDPVSDLLQCMLGKHAELHLLVKACT